MQGAGKLCEAGILVTVTKDFATKELWVEIDMSVDQTCYGFVADSTGTAFDGF